MRAEALTYCDALTAAVSGARLPFSERPTAPVCPARAEAPRYRKTVNSRTRLVTAWGTTKPLAAWVPPPAEYARVHSRLKSGWTPEEALSTPPRSPRPVPALTEEELLAHQAERV